MWRRTSRCTTPDARDAAARLTARKKKNAGTRCFLPYLSDGCQRMSNATDSPEPRWIFEPNTLSSMPVRYEESADGTVVRLVSSHRPHPSIVFALMALSVTAAAVFSIFYFVATGLSRQAEFLLIGGAILALAFGIGMIGLLYASTSIHARKPAWLEFDRGSGMVRIPRQSLEIRGTSETQFVIAALTGWTLPSLNARQSQTRLLQIQIWSLPPNGHDPIPLITRTSSGAFTTSQFRRFAAATGMRFLSIDVHKDLSPTLREIGHLRFDAY